MALIACKECKGQVSNKAQTCPNCGAKIKKTSGCLAVVGACFLLFLLIGIISNLASPPSQNSKPSPRPEESSNSKDTASQPQEKEAADPAVIRQRRLETLAKLTERYNTRQEHNKKYYATATNIQEINADKISLASLIVFAAPDKDFPDHDVKSQAEKLGAMLEKQHRVFFASAMEEFLIKAGMNVEIRAMGPEAKKLVVEYILMSKVVVYKFENEAHISANARKLGFEKLVYQDGYDDIWELSLKTEQ